MGPGQAAEPNFLWRAVLVVEVAVDALLGWCGAAEDPMPADPGSVDRHVERVWMVTIGGRRYEEPAHRHIEHERDEFRRIELTKPSPSH